MVGEGQILYTNQLMQRVAEQTTYLSQELPTLSCNAY
jgi:hypothetical protein